MEESEFLLQQDNISRLPEVRIFAYTQGGGPDHRISPTETTVFGAKGCFDERASDEIWANENEKYEPEIFRKREYRILSETAGRGHGAVLDQNQFVLVIEGLPRIATLQICQPEYLALLQQSLRRANADRGFYLPPEILNSRFSKESIQLLSEVFLFYEEMKLAGINAEDARIILPLATRTNIQVAGDAREFMHLHAMSREDYMPSIIRYTVEEMMNKTREICPDLMAERKASYERLAWYPSAQLFALSNPFIEYYIPSVDRDVTLIDSSEPLIPSELIDSLLKGIEVRDEAALSFLKHYHYTFLAKMSLMSFHQAIRQRSWNQSCESVYSAALRKDYITPRSINQSSIMNDKYHLLTQEMFSLYERLVDSGISQQEAISVLPHSLLIYDLLHINGWNAIHSIGQRTCTEAQWEIRHIATKMAEVLRIRNPFLNRFARPRGVVYGECPEKHNCGYCEAFLKSHNK